MLNSEHNIMKRGALIVIEGVDRTGKSTQAKTLGNSTQLSIMFYRTPILVYERLKSDACK